MQMLEYIYLGTTPMYFLGASGRIVDRIETLHPQQGPLLLLLLLPALLLLLLFLLPAAPSDTPEIYEQTSRVPKANRPASYGAIQFNFQNKQALAAVAPCLLFNLFRNSQFSGKKTPTIIHISLFLSKLYFDLFRQKMLFSRFFLQIS